MRHNPRGNGLGLSICKKICQALGGDIWIDSTSPNGTTFKFTVKSFKTDIPCIEEDSLEILLDSDNEDREIES